MKLDSFDHHILRVLQRDATLSMDALADRVHLSRNATWRRIKIMEEVVDVAGHAVGADHGRVVDSPCKACGPVRPVAARANEDDRQERHAELGRVHERHAADDQARLLHDFDAPPCGVARQVHAISERIMVDALAD
ncbi:MAG: Lrp/AsnC family transcriptional regulator, partial [Pseudomonadota bacterium]